VGGTVLLVLLLVFEPAIANLTVELVVLGQVTLVKRVLLLTLTATSRSVVVVVVIIAIEAVVAIVTTTAIIAILIIWRIRPFLSKKIHIKKKSSFIIYIELAQLDLSPLIF
jgi:hypothetical protein